MNNGFKPPTVSPIGKRPPTLTRISTRICRMHDSCPSKPTVQMSMSLKATWVVWFPSQRISHIVMVNSPLAPPCVALSRRVVIGGMLRIMPISRSTLQACLLLQLKMVLIHPPIARCQQKEFRLGIVRFELMLTGMACLPT